jgi:hypothetical protein
MPVTDADDFRGNDRFVVERRLGGGAYGVVYRAFDRERGTTVALKTLRGADVEALYRLKNEFRLLQGIAHPNLVTLHELLEDEGRWFFTMELVEGVNFLEHVRGLGVAGPAPKLSPDAAAETTRSRPTDATSDDAGDEEPTGTGSRPARVPLNADRLRFALRQAVEGLQALHAAGKLHRDIKPSNILVSHEGRVVLLDFGLVVELGGSGPDQSLSLVGTPSYMSPEQGTGREVTEASDWYALGVVLYQALTGRRPFEGAFVEMMWEKRQRDPTPPSQLAFGIPEDLDRLCQDMLRRSPEERPTGEEIARRLAGPRPARRPTATVPPRAAPFVGRGPHMEALQAAYDAALAGAAVAVFVHGSSGMGKTSLVRRFLDGLKPGQAVVLTGRCYERESVPYKAFDSVVDSLSQYLKRLPEEQAEALMPRDVLALARLFPVLRRVEAVAAARRRVLEIPDSQELRRRAFAALKELLGRMADQMPLVVFVDDLQWGDVDSAALLSDLLRPPDPPAMLLIGAYRSEEETTSPLLKALSPRQALEAGRAREVIVAELTQAEAQDLARALLDDAPEEARSADLIARESGGSPLFIDELVRYVRTSAAAPPSRGPHDEMSDATLARVIQSRLARLAEQARRLLQIVSVAGRPVTLAVAREAAGLESLGDAITALRAGHLARTRGSDGSEEIEPYHDRIREAVVAGLEAERLRFLHRRLATALEASGAADPEALALHLQEAGEYERAASYAIAAAERASEALAFDRAARLYRLALDLGAGQERPQRRQLQVRLGDALANAGRGQEAAHAYLAGADGAPAADALELRRRAADQLLRSGHLDEGFPLAEAVLSRLGMKLFDTPVRTVLLFLLHRLQIFLRGLGFRERDASQIPAEELIRVDTCWTAAVGLANVNPIRGRDFQNRHLLLALEAGEPLRASIATSMEAGYSAVDGWRKRERTERLIQNAAALAARVGHPRALAMARLVASLAAELQGRWRASWDIAREAEEILRESCTGVAWELAFLHIFSLRALSYLGEIRELSYRLPVLILEAQERNDLLAAATLRIRHSYLALLAADQPREALENVRDAVAHWSHVGFQSQHFFALVAETEVALAAGEAPRALELLSTQWSSLKRSRLLAVQLLRAESLSLRARSKLAVAAASGGRAGNAALLRAAELDAARIEREAAPWTAPLAAAVRAGVAIQWGNASRAMALYGDAERGFAQADMALHAAVARRRRGEILAGEEGRALVAETEAWMAGQSIKSPERVAAMLAPGRRD